MIISSEENITKNIDCEEIYSSIFEEITQLATKNLNSKSEMPSITHSEQKNPFVQESESDESVDTFVPIGSLKAHIKIAVEEIYSDLSYNDLNKFLTMIIQIKNTSYGKTTKFSVKVNEFLKFLKSYFINTKQFLSPIENFIQMLEIDNNREIVKPFAIKYFKVVFYLQKPIKPTFYEISVMFNLLKLYFNTDFYFSSVINFILKEYTFSLSRKYSCNSKIDLDQDHCIEFCKMITNTINAFNGSIIELETEAIEISKVIYTMLVFFLKEQDSVLNRLYSWKELFYCSLRSVYQGKEFAKRLECMISSKLRWKFAMDHEEYTIDKVYQTIFKYEYKLFIGKIRSGLGDNFSISLRQFVESDCQSSSDKDQRVMVTKIIQKTPKTLKGDIGYAFSPLSRRIGEQTPKKETLNSKRKLRFD